ncbi:hypothetical protein BDD14_3621 [Edaphobacter modestus]|uniref:Uncharacterized protein n=1 Tax=Edaphobacter modestus TaxID=388466 RepID=A0A4Q7YY58_9BACT|nr:hypothetical protein BDD14_3621 [Edaphobacter modestus]
MRCGFACSDEGVIGFRHGWVEIRRSGPEVRAGRDRRGLPSSRRAWELRIPEFRGKCGATECNQFWHPVQRYAATKCKVMLPFGVTECCHLRRSQMGVQISTTPKAGGAATAVRSGRGRSYGWRVRCGFADYTAVILESDLPFRVRRISRHRSPHPTNEIIAALHQAIYHVFLLAVLPHPQV